MGALAPIRIDRTGPRPLSRQLANAIRGMIESGRLKSGARLPATRLVAKEVGVSRLVAVTAYEELATAGYLHSVTGAGTFVQWKPRGARAAAKATRAQPRNKDHRAVGRSVCMLPMTRQAFEIDHPPVDAFPLKTWSRLASRCCARDMRDVLTDDDPAGFMPLRRAIADQLLETRDFRCGPDRIVIVSGLIQALDLTARTLIKSGEEVCFEEPRRPVLRAVLANAGAAIIPVPVDAEGLVVEAARRVARHPRLIMATSSRHHPLGVVLSERRRAELLEWRWAHDAWLFEDNSEHELAVTAGSLPVLATSDSDARTIFYGAFRSTISPALRLGFVVVPDALVDRFLAVRILTDGYRPLFEQSVLAEFMASGQYASHVRRIRDVYLERQAALTDAVQSRFGHVARRVSADGGLNTAFHMPGPVDILAERAASAGLVVRSLRSFFAASPESSGFILGHAAIEPEQGRAAVAMLARLWQSLEASRD